MAKANAAHAAAAAPAPAPVAPPTPPAPAAPETSAPSLQPPAVTTIRGMPDLRIKENRERFLLDPTKKADGTPNMRLKVNRPDLARIRNENNRANVRPMEPAAPPEGEAPPAPPA